MTVDPATDPTPVLSPGPRPVGRLHHVVIDCADPAALARFYSAMLGLPVTFTSPDWVVVAGSPRESGIAFQRVHGFVAPRWPSQRPGQQFHLDVMCDDLAIASRQAESLGAVRLDHDATGPHVFADPAGHPFCLIPRPEWAPPVNGDVDPTTPLL